MSHADAVKTQVATQPDNSIVTMGFGSLQSFEFMQRTAKMFAVSSMVPSAYRAVIEKGYGDNLQYVDNPAAVPNCIIALNMSQRMNADPLMIMQNLHVIEGRPSWSSQFIIAAINSCGRYSPLRFDLVKGEEMDASFTTYEWENKKKIPKTSTVRTHEMSCVAWAVELSTNQRLESPKISISMAVAEGWFGKNGSKWRTMPEVMLRYRAAAFFGRIYAPELLMGLPAAEEVHDVIDVELQKDGTYAATEQPKADPKPPQSKSEKTKQAESKPAPEVKATDVEFKEASESPAPANEAKAEEVTTAAAETAESVPGKGLPLSDSESTYIKFKLEEAALSSNDVFKKFGIRPEQVTQTEFKDVLAWIKSPD
ncbi:hypothetical protein [Undibacterium umbellatum]|uniref:Recombinase RecT n=1 Tax=Undibacterium umbellatum TaxID=2762300 RepID=A0ABR6Z3P2_9BURK|nr:hypothetical protein [Undibacterium umbellatum]MBC3906239.1 hypothetical protein [Undibacterium umbellatum]